MFLDCSGRMKHKSVGEAIDLLFDDIEMMHSKGASRRFNVTKIMRRLKGLCQNGTEYSAVPAIFVAAG